VSNGMAFFTARIDFSLSTEKGVSHTLQDLFD